MREDGSPLLDPTDLMILTTLAGAVNSGKNRGKAISYLHRHIGDRRLHLQLPPHQAPPVRTTTFAVLVDSDMLRLIAARKAELQCGRTVRHMRWEKRKDLIAGRLRAAETQDRS